MRERHEMEITIEDGQTVFACLECGRRIEVRSGHARIVEPGDLNAHHFGSLNMDASAEIVERTLQ